MNINRNNYEEYFLLYVDNELSAADKNMVEVFVAENPDLQEEMLMLQQSIVKPDSVVLLNKDSLLKPQPVDAETKEKLLLLLDNELPGKEKQQLLSAIKSNKAIEQEWQLLQQTKLSVADKIIFKNKASIYKKEPAKIVATRWWQIAAAAMLIGFGLWGTVSYLNRSGQSTNPSGTVANSGTTKPAGDIQSSEVIKNDTAQNTARIRTIQNSDATAVSVSTKQNKKDVVKTTVPVNKNIKQEVPDDNMNNDIVQQKINTEVPKVDLRNLNNNGSNNNTAVNVTPQINKDKIEVPESITQSADITAINTSAGDSDDSGFDEDDGDKPGKSKLGGFFKKVKRVIERKTKIKTGSSDDIKIANMSFAMH